LSKVKVIILDIDLTLCNNLERKVKSIERALGKSIEDSKIRRRIAYSYGFGKVLKNLGVKDIKEFKSKALYHFFYDLDLFNYDKPFDGASEIVKELDKEYKIYYVTGRPIKETALQFLRKNNFPLREVYNIEIKPGESWKKVKIFKDILKKEKVNAEEVVAVGDLPGDAIAAKKLGFRTIGVCKIYKSFKKKLEKICDIVLEDIRELPKTIKELETC